MKRLALSFTICSLLVPTFVPGARNWNSNCGHTCIKGKSP